jgi:hypothetical protein
MRLRPEGLDDDLGNVERDRRGGGGGGGGGRKLLGFVEEQQNMKDS